MLEFTLENSTLVGPYGIISFPDNDKTIRKLTMLIEGRCQGCGPSKAAKKFGYTKQRYFQLLAACQKDGITALQDKARGPKTNYRRVDAIIRRVIRHRFLDPDSSPEVITQKIQQAGHIVSIRSVQRIIAEYGLQKKTPFTEP